MVGKVSHLVAIHCGSGLDEFVQVFSLIVGKVMFKIIHSML